MRNETEEVKIQRVSEIRQAVEFSVELPTYRASVVRCTDGMYTPTVVVDMRDESAWGMPENEAQQLGTDAVQAWCFLNDAMIRQKINAELAGVYEAPDPNYAEAFREPKKGGAS